MSGGGIKLKVDALDEVFYPVVSVQYTGKVEVVEGTRVFDAGKAEVEANEVEKEINETKIESEVVEIKPEEIEVESKEVEVEPIEVEAETKEVKPTVLVDVIQNKNEPKRKRGRIWRSRLMTIATAVVAVVAVVLVGLRLAGFRTFTVMSGSMDPEYPVGAMIYVKPVDYQSLKVGDVISFVANDDKTVVTHRIVDIEVDENDANVWRFKTKGDANDTADGKAVHYKNVLGTPIITIPHIGYFAHNIQQPPGIYIALIAGTLLLAWTFMPGTLEERRKTARKSAASER